MRILLCASELPADTLNGLQLVAANIRDELSTRHEVRVAGFTVAGEISQPAAVAVPWGRWRLARRVGGLITAVITGRPMHADRAARRLGRHLGEHIEWCDAAIVLSPVLAGLGPLLSERPSVLAGLDSWSRHLEGDIAQSRGPRRWLLRGELRRVRRFEAQAYAAFDSVVLVSEQDARAVAELNPSLDVHTIPNGVSAPQAPLWERAAVVPGRIMLHGVMDYPPNVAAARFLARRVLPLVRTQRPDAAVVLVGRSPSREVRALGQLDGVTVTGAVTDLAPSFASSHVYACPMVSGTGIKNKLLEAMAAGMPCVSSTLALQGLCADSGKHLLAADGAERLAAALIDVMDDDDMATDLGAAARDYALANHSWAAVVGRYESLLDRTRRCSA